MAIDRQPEAVIVLCEVGAAEHSSDLILVCADVNDNQCSIEQLVSRDVDVRVRDVDEVIFFVQDKIVQEGGWACNALREPEYFFDLVSL